MEGGSSRQVVDAMVGLNLGSERAGPSASYPSAGNGAALPPTSAAAAVPAAASSSGSTAHGAGVVIGPTCQLCDKEVAGPPKLCGACGTVSYCSKECQKADWKVHKHLCEPSRLWRAALAAGGPPPSRAKAERVIVDEAVVAYRLMDDELAGLTDAQRTVLAASQKELEAVTLINPFDKDRISRLKALLSTLKDASGRDHVANLPVLVRLSLAFVAQGKHDDAYQYCLRALTIFEARFGPSDPGIVEHLNTLIRIQSSMRKYDEVLVHAQRFVTIEVLNNGPTSGAAAESLHKLANCLESLNRNGESAGLYRLVIATTTQLFGPESFQAVEGILSLASFYVKSAEDYAAAEPLLKDALAKIERETSVGDRELFDHLPSLAHCLYASCLAHRGDYVAAAGHRQIEVDWSIAQFGASHVFAGHALIRLADIQAKLERWAEAETNLRRGAQILTDHDDPDNDRKVARALERADFCHNKVTEQARGAGGGRGRRAPRNQRG